MNETVRTALRAAVADGGYLGGGPRKYGPRPGQRPAFMAQRATIVAATTPGVISRKWAEFIMTLLTERDLTAEVRPAWRARLLELRSNMSLTEILTPEKATALTECLKALPMRDATEVVDAAPAPSKGRYDIDTEVPAGRYAITDGTGDTGFYVVQRPTEGQWAGRIFVKRQESDETKRIPFDHQRRVIREIEKVGASAASIRYGVEKVRCGVCHRKLTNKASRKAGIGPKCAADMGW